MDGKLEAEGGICGPDAFTAALKGETTATL